MIERPPVTQLAHREQRTFAVAALVVALFAIYAVRSADADLWGHLRYGQHLLDNGGRVGADPFAYTTAGRVWNDHEYLAQMGLWLIYANAGPLGLILLKCVVGAATVFVLYCALRLGSDDARVWGPLLIIVAAGVGRWLLFRPQIFTFLILSIFVLALFRHLLDRPARLWVLPILLALWVNLHGGFLAGLGAVGLALLLRILQSGYRHGFQPRRVIADGMPLGLTLAGCFAASLLNPLGWRLWPYLITELGFAENRDYIQEWLPIHRVWNSWPALLPFFVLLAVLLFTGVLAWRNGRRVADLPAWVWLLSCVPLTWMAFQSNRHIPVQLIWVAPVAGLLAGAARNDKEQVWNAGWLGVTALAGIVGMLTLYGVLIDPRPRISVGASAFGATRPDRAVAFLKANQLQGNVYTPLWWGAYLTWELYPNMLVSLDGRNVTLFARQTMIENFRFYSDERPDLETPWRYPTDFLLVPGDTPGIEVIRADGRWSVLFEDKDAVLFMRSDNRDLLSKRDRGELKVPLGERVEFFP